MSVASVMSCPELCGQLDLDRDVEGQLGQTDGAARVPAGLAEDLDEQIGATVDDLWRLVEARRDVHHAEHLHDALDAIEITEFGLHRGEDRQRGHASGTT